MVALHNRRLTARDIWPNNIWTWDDELRISMQIEARLIDEGMSGVGLQFAHSNAMMNYRQQFPSYREQQQVMARIYPPRRAEPEKAPEFSPEELEAILERFSMANDDIGQAIHLKAAALLGVEPASPAGEDDPTP